MTERRCIIVFVKHPGLTPVKTRLAAEIGKAKAGELYNFFARDILARLARQRADLKVFFYPSSGKRAVRSWLGAGPGYYPQKGADLGARMANAFKEVFSQGYSKALLLGSDSPDLPAKYMADAWRRLKRHDVVLGPTEDGGYYLIGFERNSFDDRVFKGIEWSSDVVYRQTVDAIAGLGMNFGPLAGWLDVDLLDDLRQLYHRNRRTGFRRSATYSYLERNLKELLTAPG
jgi:rSAM/selenodomain-associated transferase 1